MEEECRVFMIGDSLFAETLAQMLLESKAVAIVGAAPSLTAALSTVAGSAPHIIVFAGTNPQTQAFLNPLLTSYPDLPIICADLGRDYVQIITTHRVGTRRDDLLAAITGLFKSEIRIGDD